VGKINKQDLKHPVGSYLVSKGVPLRVARGFLQCIWTKTLDVYGSRGSFRTYIGFVGEKESRFIFTSLNIKVNHVVEAIIYFFENCVDYQAWARLAMQRNPGTYMLNNLVTPSDYVQVSGAIFFHPGPAPFQEDPSYSAPPPENLLIHQLAKKHLPKKVVDAALANFNRSATLKPDPVNYNPLFQGVNSHPGFEEEQQFGDINEDDLFSWITSNAAISLIARAANCVATGTKSDYTNLGVPISNFMDKNIRSKVHTMSDPNGGAGDSIGDNRTGNVAGTKRDQSFIAKSTAVSFMQEIAMRIETSVSLNGFEIRPLADWLKIFTDFLDDGVWRYFYQGVVKIHRKSETIKRGKPSRLIWPEDMMAIILNTLVYSGRMSAHKCQFELGYSTGLTFKGGGMDHCVRRLITYYVKNLNSPLYADAKRQYLEAFDMSPDITNEEFVDFIESNIDSCDDDVIKWDFFQFALSFLFFDLKNMYCCGIDPKAMTQKEFMFFVLSCYTNHCRSMRLIRIKKTGDEGYENYVSSRQVASGELCTHKVNSDIHSDIRYEVNTARYLMVDSMEKNLKARLETGHRPMTPKLVKVLKAAIAVAKMGTPSLNCGDDLLDFVLKLSTLVHCHFDQMVVYAQRNGLMLKPEEFGTHNEIFKKWDFAAVQDLISPTLRSQFGLNLGQSKGFSLTRACLMDPVVLFDAEKRFHFYKPFITTLDEDHNIKVHGGVFLQMRFVIRQGDNYISLWRDPVRLVAKFLNLSDNDLTDVQWIGRIRSYAYLCINNPVIHACLEKIEREFCVSKNLTPAKIATALMYEGNEFLKEYHYNITGLQTSDVNCFPTYQRVIDFYTPRVDTSKIIERKHTRALQAPSQDHYLHKKGGYYLDPITLPKPVVDDETQALLAQLIGICDKNNSFGIGKLETYGFVPPATPV